MLLNSSHVIPLDQPAAILGAIRQLVSTATVLSAFQVQLPG